MRLKINWASLIVGSKFTVFTLFYFVFEGNFPSTSPRGAYIWRGDLTEGFLRYQFGGLIFGGAYTWRGLIFAIVRYIHWYHKCRPLITNLKTRLQMLAVQKHNPKTLKSNESTWMWESEFVSPVYTLSCVCLSTPIFTLFRQQSPLKSNFKF